MDYTHEINHNTQMVLDISTATYEAGNAINERGNRTHHDAFILGISALAHGLENNPNHDDAVRQAMAIALSEYNTQGLNPDHPAFNGYESFQNLYRSLPLTAPSKVVPTDRFASDLAIPYATVERRTIVDDEFEHDSSHVIHLGIWAVAEAMRQYPNDINPYRLWETIMEHDVLEAYTKDTAMFAPTAAALANKKQGEVMAMKRLQHEYGADFPKFVAIVEGYEHLTSDHALFAKAIDKNDAMLSHYENGGKAYKELYSLYDIASYNKANRELQNRIRPYYKEFPELWQQHSELTVLIAQQMGLLATNVIDINQGQKPKKMTEGSNVTNLASHRALRHTA